HPWSLRLARPRRHEPQPPLEALAAGAVDFVDKSRFGMMEFDGLGRELRERIKALATVRWGDGFVGAANAATGSPRRPGESVTGPSVRPQMDLCVLGAST